MNIEEKNQAAAIRRAGKMLGHLHACGSDRGTPGSDHIDWKGIAAALKRIGYKRDVSIESFYARCARDRQGGGNLERDGTQQE